MNFFKQHFIPHEENAHHAPVLHRKRHVLYSLCGIAVKGAVIMITLLLPLDVFVTPDAINAQLDAIRKETNTVRIQEGESPLIEDEKLNTSAAFKAADMRDQSYFAHTSPSGVGVADVVRMGGYQFLYAGENLAIGFSTAKDVVRAWKESPTHYKNLVHPVFEDIGVGVAIGSRNGVPVPYFVQHFGTPKDADVSVLGNFVDDTEIIVLPQSRVFWKETSDNIEIEPQIFLNREVASVTITQFATDIELSRVDTMYTAQYTLLSTVEDIFEPTLPVSIRIETIDGDIIESIVPWFAPAELTPSLITRYHMAIAYVQELMPLIIVSRVIMISIISILTLSLLAHIAWSIHIRKHQITLETLLVLSLFVVLLLV